MSAPTQEQRNAYQGSPPRAWIHLRLAAQDGQTRDFKLVADTGCPVSFIIAPDDVPEFTFGIGKSVVTNLGHLQGEWFSLAMPELGLDALMVGFVSQEAAEAVRADHPNFAGLAGLPLLRLLDFGGNDEEFWIRRRP